MSESLAVARPVDVSQRPAALDPRRELRADCLEQRVHRLSQLPNFGVRLGDGHAPVEAGALGRELCGHRAGGGGDAMQGSQAQSDTKCRCGEGNDDQHKRSKGDPARLFESDQP